jgi:uncharacterized cupin superfamily protein
MKVISHPSAPLDRDLFEKIDMGRVISGTPEAAHLILYTSKSGEMCSGIYACTAGKWRVSYTEDEFCTLTEGHIRLTSEDGTTQEYKAPDSFMIPSGFKGTWEAVTDAQKFFVIYEKTG